MNNYIIGHALHFIDYNLHIWQLRKLQHKHHYLVPSTAQECHLNDARQTSCDHVHQDSECKKSKDIVIQDPWISRELSSYYRFTQWFGPTLTATEPLFSKSGDLERVGHLIWVKIQICENHMSEHFSCIVMQCKLNEVHTFANLNSWTKKSYGCSLRKLIFQHLAESENQSHTKIIQINNVINKVTLNIK